MIRLLNDPALDGPTNMARDEALLKGLSDGSTQPTLRLYEWSTPTISLGYFQPHEAFVALGSPLSALPVVRRLTGGGAILHDWELTYSLTVPANHELLARGATALYGIVHDAVMAALRESKVVAERCGASDDSGAARGPFFCFARRHACDVLLDGEKLAGSAQRRTRDGVLQHGSVVLGSRFDQHPTARVFEANHSDAIERLREAVVRCLSKEVHQSFTEGVWGDNELTRAAALVLKYTSREWTARL